MHVKLLYDMETMGPYYINLLKPNDIYIYVVPQR